LPALGPELLLPRLGPLLLWPSPPEQPPPRKATHGPCPRGAPSPNGGGRRGAEEGERARTATGPDVDHQKGGSPLAPPAAMDAACAERPRLQIRRGPPLLRPRWPVGVLLRVSHGSATPASAATSPPHRRRCPLRPRRAARGGPDPPRPPPGLGAPPPEQPLPCGGRRSRRRCIWQQLPPWIPPRASFLLRVPSAAPPRQASCCAWPPAGPFLWRRPGVHAPVAARCRRSGPGTLPPKRKLLRRPKHLPSKRERELR